MSNKRYNKNPKFDKTEHLSDINGKVIRSLQSMLEQVFNCRRPKCPCHHSLAGQLKMLLESYLHIKFGPLILLNLSNFNDQSV